MSPDHELPWPRLDSSNLPLESKALTLQVRAVGNHKIKITTDHYLLCLQAVVQNDDQEPVPLLIAPHECGGRLTHGDRIPDQKNSG